MLKEKGGYPLDASTPYMRIIAHTHTYYMLWSLASSGYPPYLNIKARTVFQSIIVWNLILCRDDITWVISLEITLFLFQSEISLLHNGK
jgi:hypothetical protein